MGLFEILFPQISAAEHLRTIASTQARSEAEQRKAERHRDREQAVTSEALKMRIDTLENDLGFVVLALTSLLGMLDEKGTITRDELARELRDLDFVDGRDDNRLSTTVLKKYFSNRQ